MRKTYLIAIAATAFGAAAAQAHPKLLSASPAANSVGAAPARIELHFSEGLVAAFSTIDLVDKKSAAKIAVKTEVVGGKTLVGVAAKPLHPGVYSLTYHVTSIDTHRVQASYDFTVR